MVGAKNIAVKYGYEGDMKDSEIFTVKDDESNKTLELIINLLDEFSFTSCGVSMGSSFITDEKNIVSFEEIKDYLITSFEALKDVRKGLKLTK